MSKEQKIVIEMRKSLDPKIRLVAERLAKTPGWKAEDLRDVLKEMLGR